jgi:hypothetical protein
MSKNFYVILHPKQNSAKSFCKIFEKLPLQLKTVFKFTAAHITLKRLH